MRVLHIVGDSKFGGGSMVIVQLAEMASHLGCHVEVLTTDPAFQDVLRRAGIGVVDLQVVWRSIRPLRDLLGLWRLYRFLKTTPFTLVQTHTSKAGVVGRLAATLAGAPAIIHTAHGFAFHEQSHPLVIKVCALIERLAAHWCDRIVTVSEFHRAWGVRLGIADGAKMIAISNGIPEDRVTPSVDRASLRAYYGVSPEEMVILSTGRLAPQKGLESLIDAIPGLNARLGRPFKVWLAGDGPLKEALAHRVGRLGVVDKVCFLGFRNDVRELLSASDVVVLPTQREGLSIALLEAMAAGKAIVTTPIGSNLEVTRGGEGAVLVPPGRPRLLASAICDLARNPRAAEELGKRARCIYLKSYTEEMMLSAWAREYSRVADQTLAHLTWPVREPLGYGFMFAQTVKRGLDILGAAAGLAVCAPLMVAIAAAVRLTSPGAALFRQQRVGLNGRPFTMYKFRSMEANARDLRNPDGSAFTGQDDPRVTPLGRILRATSLDELPQLINVLKADMSLVGPRPDLPDQLRFYTAADRQKLRVKPGITGLAQLSGRNGIPWERRRQLDVVYAKKNSLLFDLEIILRTIPYVLRRRGVYGEGR